MSPASEVLNMHVGNHLQIKERKICQSMQTVDFSQTHQIFMDHPHIQVYYIAYSL